LVGILTVKTQTAKLRIIQGGKYNLGYIVVF